MNPHVTYVTCYEAKSWIALDHSREVSVKTARGFVSHKVFLKSFCRRQLSHRSVNVSSTIDNINKGLFGN